MKKYKQSEGKRSFTNAKEQTVSKQEYIKKKYQHYITRHNVNITKPTDKINDYKVWQIILFNVLVILCTRKFVTHLFSRQMTYDINIYTIK